jgi:hypothetical protein
VIWLLQQIKRSIDYQLQFVRSVQRIEPKEEGKVSLINEQAIMTLPELKYED